MGVRSNKFFMKRTGIRALRENQASRVWAAPGHTFAKTEEILLALLSSKFSGQISLDPILSSPQVPEEVKVMLTCHQEALPHFFLFKMLPPLCCPGPSSEDQSSRQARHAFPCIQRARTGCNCNQTPQSHLRCTWRSELTALGDHSGNRAAITPWMLSPR